MKFKIISLLLYAISAFTYSQQDEFIVSRMQSSDQYPYKLTYTMLQDNKGFLWFGTMYGLLRYDGVQTIPFRNDIDDSTSLGFDDVVSLYQDNKDNLWIGTWGGGLVKYDMSTGKFFTFVAEKNGLTDNIIWAITEDVDGNVWLGTQSAGLCVYSPDANTFMNFLNEKDTDKHIPTGYISSLLTDSNGNIWIGTQQGIHKYIFEEKKFTNYILDEHDSSKVLSNNITSIKEYDNKIWISTRNGLFLYDDSQNRFTKFTNVFSNNINSMAIDNKEFIWLSTMTGLVKFNPATSESNHISKYLSDKILPAYTGSMMIDRSGVVWACSYEWDLFKIAYKPEAFSKSFLRDTSNLLSANVFSIASSDNNIWAGTSNGLLEINKKTGDVNAMPELAKYPLLKAGILSMCKSDDELYLATKRGLLVYNLSSRELNLPETLTEVKPFRINYVMKDRENKIWIGTYDRGVYKYDKVKDSLKHYDLRKHFGQAENSNYILKIFQDTFGRIWIGTYAGLCLIENDNFVSFSQDRKNRTSLSNNYVYSIYEDSKKRIWVGTAKGLNLYSEKEKSFKTFYQKDGLSNDVVASITEDAENNLWITTFNGLTRFNYEKNEFKIFTKENGLTGNYFNPNSILFSDGKIYAGSSTGLSIINPAAIEKNNPDADIILASLTLLNNEGEDKTIYHVNDEIELSYNENSMKILLSSTDYRMNGKAQFNYKFDGVENKLSDNELLLSNLSPGNHKLEISIAGSDEQRIKSFLIIIHPPFWQTWWFILIVVFLTGIILFTSYKLMIKKKIKRVLEIEKIKSEESEKIRKKTAIDFHDELGHRLTRISVLTGLVRKKLQNRFDDIDPLLDKISDNSSALYDGTKDFIWSIDPSNDSLYELMIRIKDFGDELFTDGKINFEVRGISEKLSGAFVDMDWKRHLSLILKEGMNNSLKHSHASKIILETNVNQNELEIILEDDGIGIISDSKQGNGLKNMQKRAEKLSGHLDIQTEKGKGTKISFRGKIPAKSLNYS